MKAAVFYGKHDIRIEDMPVRPPDSGEVVIKTAYCGICGTDLHIYHGEEGPAGIDPPVILGHEMSGVVVETGKTVTGLAVGDHVAVDPNFYCGACYYCGSGQKHFCSGMNAFGVNYNGGFAEYCTLPAKAAIKAPKSLPLEVAAFAEPLSCCLHGMDLTGVRPGDNVLLIGGGTIGLLMLQLARISGASALTLIEPEADKRAIAERFGADNTFAGEGEYQDFVSKTPGIRADKVIECVGKAETVSFAIRAATKGATVMLFGLTPPKAAVEILPFEIFKKELCIRASFVNPYTEVRAMDLLGNNKIDAGKLIGERVPLDKLTEVFNEPSYRAKMKMLVEFR